MAGGVEAFRLFGVIEINKGQVSADLKTVEGAVNKTASKVGTDLHALGGSLRNIGMMVGVPLAAAAAGLVKLGIGTADYAEQLRNQSNMTGLTIQQLQEYRFICEQNQISTEALTNASAFLQRNLMGMEEGTGNAAKVMADLGIEIHNADGSLRPMSQLLPQVIEKLSGMTNETQRGMYTAQIFGRGWKEMAPLLAMGTAEINRMKQAAHDLGLIWSDEMYQAAGKVDAQMDLLTARMQGMTVTILSNLLPSIEYLLKKAGDVVTVVVGWAKEFPGLTKGILDATLALGGLSVLVTPLLLTLPTLISLIVNWTEVSAALGAVWAIASGPAGWIALTVAALAALALVLWKVFHATEAVADIQFDTERSKQLAEYETDIAKATEKRAAALKEIGRLERAIEQGTRFGTVPAGIAGWKKQIAEQTAEYDKQTAAVARLTKQMTDFARAGAKPLTGVGVATFEDYEKALKLNEALAERDNWSTARRLANLRALDKAFAAVLKGQVEAEGSLHAKIRALEAETAADAKKRGEDARAQNKAAFDERLAAFEALIQKRKDLEGLGKGEALTNAEVAAGYTRIMLAFKPMLLLPENAKLLADMQHRVNQALIDGQKAVKAFLDPLATYNDRIQAARVASSQWALTIDDFVSSGIPRDYLEWLEKTGTATAKIIDPMELYLSRLREAGEVLESTNKQTQDMIAGDNILAAYFEGIVNKAKPAAAKIGADWVNVARNIHDAFASAFEGLMTGARNFGGFITDLCNSIQKAFANLVAQMVADWLFGIDQMESTGQAGGLLGKLFNWAAGGFGAGGGGGANPMIGAGAPPAYTQTQGFGGQGRSEPRLTPAYAGAPVTLNVTVNAIDAAGVADVFFRNRGALGAAIQTAIRENNPIGRRR